MHFPYNCIYLTTVSVQANDQEDQLHAIIDLLGFVLCCINVNFVCFAEQLLISGTN